jgi:hypothetical protein
MYVGLHFIACCCIAISNVTLCVGGESGVIVDGSTVNGATKMCRYCTMLCERQGITACECLVGGSGGGGPLLVAISVSSSAPTSKALPTATIYSDAPLLTPPRGRG